MFVFDPSGNVGNVLRQHLIFGREAGSALIISLRDLCSSHGATDESDSAK
jgi:hypothetical protein